MTGNNLSAFAEDQLALAEWMNARTLLRRMSPEDVGADNNGGHGLSAYVARGYFGEVCCPWGSIF